VSFRPERLFHCAHCSVVCPPEESSLGVTCSNLACFFRQAYEYLSLERVQHPSSRPYVWTNCVASMDGKTTFAQRDFLSPAVALADCSEMTTVLSSSASSSASSSSSSCQSLLQQTTWAGAALDWRLLLFGWALADAVLGSGENLRREPRSLRWSCHHLPALSALRISRFGKTTAHPIAAILTWTGDLPLDHVYFQPSCTELEQSQDGEDEQQQQQRQQQQVVVFSTPRGAKHFEQRLGAERLRAAAAHLHVIAIPEANSLSELASGALSELGRRFAVRFVDVAAGARVRGALLSAQLLDEVRVTLAGQLIGSSSVSSSSSASVGSVSSVSSSAVGSVSSGSSSAVGSVASSSPSTPSSRLPSAASASSSSVFLQALPSQLGSPSTAMQLPSLPSTLFEMPDSSAPHTPHTTPLVDYVAIRAFGRRHLFLRGLISYQAEAGEH